MKSEILGIRLDEETKERLYAKIIELAKLRLDKPILVVRPNAEIITYAQKNPEFKKILNSAAVAIPDGIGVVLAAKLLDVKIAGRFGGPESMFEIMKLADKNKLSVYLLGSKAEVVKDAAANIKKALPNLRLVGFHDGYFKVDGRIIAEINKLRPDIIFVGMGFPKQETWVYSNLKKFAKGVFVMEGGSFDYLAGKIQRAPVLFQKLGLEWLFRLIQEPWRSKRQLALIKFVFLVFKQRLTTSSN